MKNDESHFTRIKLVELYYAYGAGEQVNFCQEKF